MNAARADGHMSGRSSRQAFAIGVAAAVVMAAVLAVVRYTTGTPSLPELFGEAIIGLLPPPVFSALIDALQRAAKPLLYAGVGAGMLLVGGLLGQGFAFGAPTWGRAVRLAAVLWAVFGLVLLPLMGGGLFGGVGLRTGVVALAIQQALAFGSFTAALVLLLRATDSTQAAPVLSQRRRAAVMTLTSGLALVALGGAAWRALLGSSSPSAAGVSTLAPAAPLDAGRAAGSTAQDRMDASQAAPSPVAASASPVAGPARGLPPLDAPPV
ncbi:MAG: hypothetical protein IT337_16955, partial [Thermomicrobiales bacterium]|nr:hypothetical protein [Thermomicrobiales bacterium]